MVKTTVYLPEGLKRRLQHVARVQGRSEADIIRAALDEFTAAQERPRPKLPLFSSGRGDIAERVDEILAEGFGRD
jgi:Ribbon-helix-helix protein, copG family